MTTLITGTSRGIGLQLLKDYAAAGEPVIGTTRSGTGHEVDGAEILPLDVTNLSSFAALVRALSGRRIDLVVCNAGIFPDREERLADGYPPQMWADTFATNVTGVFLTVQNLLTNLQLSDVPKIAILSSQMGSDTRAAGREEFSGCYIYRASKAAVLNLGLNLANDLRHLGIAVGVYHPGWVRTEMGGHNAKIGVEEATAGLRARFSALSMHNTGCFETWDGQTHPY
ncbi:NADP-dependent 3-hydroxy acid dehydrogenase YdfG [Rhodovulum imhoffii]|uniref:NADP-dependent 3-hydroxy acid dehydrogenase YdfG n=1 Tax=Rhodovulum imhoffii TaxID=365340 RepID=A0A2T5BR26_9RHOB|nr:SDR family NAD(P)-dependent oxidoreductase [Rhodovulum imhoffii]MBK5934981.1 short-chain dehydrogenase [Rhodovulum imhoffii]PTN01668.1 NADP-dependent 3-hydroxy acid dehydrogenase YdfG [Rhodovulum imhoffii]